MSSPPLAMSAPISLGKLTGAAFVGFVVSVAIYGITCLQAYLYYVDYSSGDRKFLKLFVAVLVALDTLHVALVTHALYWYMVTNFDDVEDLFHIIWSLSVQVGVAELLAICVQNFLAWRVYLLSGKKNVWVPAIVVVSGVGLLASAIGFMIEAFRYDSFLNNSANVPWSIATTVFEIFPDSLIMVSMIHYLVKARTGFDRTQKLLNTLIMYTLNTGLLTTIFAVLNLAFFTRYHNTLLYAPFFFIFCRIYACSFLSTLNTRHALRESSVNTSTQDSVALSDFARRAHAPGRDPITFTTTHDTFRDGGSLAKDKAINSKV